MPFKFLNEEYADKIFVYNFIICCNGNMLATDCEYQESL